MPLVAEFVHRLVRDTTNRRKNCSPESLDHGRRSPFAGVSPRAQTMGLEHRRMLGHEIQSKPCCPLPNEKWSLGLLGTASHIGESQSRHETAALVESVHASVLPTALKQDVIAASRPGLRKRSLNHGSTVPSSLELRMCHYVLEECMPVPSSQQIWCSNQHACCHDFSVAFRHEDSHAATAQRVSPDLMSAFERLNSGTNFRYSKEIEQGFQICHSCCPCNWHANLVWADTRRAVVYHHH
jgi:hypothetical protein